MKKIYFLFLLSAFSTLSYAQSLNALNVTSIVYGLPSDAQLQALIDIENIGVNSIDVSCERIDVNTLPGSENSFCWGALCYPSTTSMSLLPATISSGAIDASFRGDYIPNHATGISYVDYVFADVNNPTDAITVSIQYDTQTLGIDNINSQNTYLNVSSRPGNSLIAVAYNVSGSSTNQLKVYNLLGNNVKNFNINKNGTMVVSTTGLSNGVYVFCLESNGKTVATKKFVVSK